MGRKKIVVTSIVVGGLAMPCFASEDLLARFRAGEAIVVNEQTAKEADLDYGLLKAELHSLNPASPSVDTNQNGELGVQFNPKTESVDISDFSKYTHTVPITHVRVVQPNYVDRTTH